MVRVEIDPITKRVLSYTKVASNTQIYDTDILLSEADLPEGLENALSYTEEGFTEASDDCYSKIEELNKKIEELSSKTDSEYFLSLVLEGSSLKDARESVQTRKAQRDTYAAEREAVLEEHKRHIQDHYLAENRKIDAAVPYTHYSAVILLIKDENRYLKEWLDHHLDIGFDHIYIYDNGSNENVNAVILDYPEETKEKITVINWRGHHEHIQQDAYNHFMSHHKTEVRWGLFIDSDEFLRFIEEDTKVNDFLKGYEDYTEIWGYEVEYNANGQEKYEDKPVRERFTQQTDVREGFYWKNFVQVNRITQFLMHYAQYDTKKHLLYKNEQSNQDLFVIDHYYTKSWEEWQWKIKERGGADPYYHKALKEFFVYNPDMTHLDTGENVVQSYEGVTP